MKYQIIINDWNGPDPEEAKWDAFVVAINNGEIEQRDVDFIEVN